MSGLMDWGNGYAEETDVGAYLPGMGTAEIPGGAAGQGGGPHAWDMDWSWGSEMVPLEYPGFEVDGSGGAVFGGWEQFGQYGEVSVASHGSQAARVTGPGGVEWDVSGYWQRLDSEPGEQWVATGRARHPSTNPLTGACTALVNIEWRDASGDLLSYDSFTVADAGSPTDEYIEFEVLSNPAPSGTAPVLQRPLQPRQRPTGA